MTGGVTLLDCTLRDGGYYTNWDFAPELAVACIEACDAAGVDVVELGYVRFKEAGYGAFGRLPAPVGAELGDRIGGSRLRFAAMLDAFDAYDLDPREVGPRIRDKLGESAVPIELIRIAVRYDQAERTASMVESLTAAGFGVCLNLMQIGLAGSAQVDELLAVLAGFAPMEAVYIADSLGSLQPEPACDLVSRFRAALDVPIGFHAHENQGLALHNSLRVLDAGATWLDATMRGMGRGAGNARMEQLLGVLSPDSDLRPVHEFVAGHMDPLHDKYGWGANVYYALAGARRIHPTYVQLLEESRMQTDEKLRALRFLSGVPATSFSVDRLREAFAHA